MSTNEHPVSDIVDSRLARARALLFAMEAAALRADDTEFDRVKSVLGVDVTNRPC
jgi:hypothetical protein